MPSLSQSDFDLQSLPIPAALPCYVYQDPDNIDLLSRLGPVLSLSRGHVLRTTQSARYCYMVLSGQMAAGTLDGDTFSYVTAIMCEGSLLFEPSTHASPSASIAFKAIAPTRLVRIDQSVLAETMRQDQRVFDAIMMSSSLKVYSSFEKLREAQSLDIRSRVYLLLYSIASSHGSSSGDGWRTLEIKLTQQLMGDLLGVNRVTVNTALQDLYARGAVRKVEGRYSVFSPHFKTA